MEKPEVVKLSPLPPDPQGTLLKLASQVSSFACFVPAAGASLAEAVSARCPQARAVLLTRQPVWLPQSRPTAPRPPCPACTFLVFFLGLLTSGPLPKGALATLAAGPEPCPAKTSSCPRFSDGPRPCSLQTNPGEREPLQSQVVCKTVPREEKDKECWGERQKTNFPPILRLKSSRTSLPRPQQKHTRKRNQRNRWISQGSVHQAPSSFASLCPVTSLPALKLSPRTASSVYWQSRCRDLCVLNVTNRSALCKGLPASQQTCNYEGEPTNGHLCGHWKDDEICPTNRERLEKHQKGKSTYGTLCWVSTAG